MLRALHALFNPQNGPTGKYYYFPHITDEEVETWNSRVTCPPIVKGMVGFFCGICGRLPFIFLSLTQNGSLSSVQCRTNL